MFSYWDLSNHTIGPADIAILAEEARDFPLKDGERVLVEIGTDLYVPLFVHYLFGPGYLKLVSYPHLWSGKAVMNAIDPQYEIHYNIAAFQDVHPLRSASRVKLAKVNWLMLLYSNWDDKFWEGSFRETYHKKLEANGMADRVQLVRESSQGAFNLAIFQVMPLEGPLDGADLLDRPRGDLPAVQEPQEPAGQGK